MLAMGSDRPPGLGAVFHSGDDQRLADDIREEIGHLCERSRDYESPGSIRGMSFDPKGNRGGPSQSVAAIDF